MHSVPTTTYRIQEVADDQNQLKNLRQDLTLKNIYRKRQLQLSDFKLLLALVYQVFSVITLQRLFGWSLTELNGFELRLLKLP